MKGLILLLLLFSSSLAVADDFSLHIRLNENGTFLKENTCSGRDISPAVSWKNPPARTRSYMLVLEDPDASFGTWYQWVVFNIPARYRYLAPGTSPFSASYRMLANSSGLKSYSGPCSSNGASHHYVFKLYSLDIFIPESEISLRNFKSVIQGHVLGLVTEVVGA